ncbi:FtsX-like permease family protein [Lactovum odontotermitis]
MKTKILNRNIRRSITGSLGRFLSIFLLMGLGVFAFTGLKVSGPDMRATAEHFYETRHLADLTVTSTYGLDKSDQTLISSADGLKQAEYGYFKDVLIKGTDTSLRVFSAPEKLSTYQLISGKMPQNDQEIALDYLFRGKYKLGDTLALTETKTDGADLLKNHRFKITGFVKSSEYVDKNNFGQTNIGTGQLNGYAVTVKDTFQSDVYMIARLSYSSMSGLSPYDDQFQTLSSKNETALKKLLDNQPEKRLAAVKAESQQKINDARAQIAAGLATLTESQNLLDQQQELMKELEDVGITAEPAQLEQLQTSQAKFAANRQKLTESSQELDQQEKDLQNLALPVYTVNNRKEGNQGYQTYIDNSQRIDTLSDIFPVVLFTIAALVCLTTMTRFVEEDRSALGLLKALGYTKRQIRRKFLVYGFISAFAGAVVGAILGHTFLPYAVFNAYTASSTISDLRLTFSLPWTIAAFFVAIICTVLSAYFIADFELRESPVSLFLAKPPKAGSRILLERIRPIWRRLSFTYKVTARNLFRYKKRMLMTIFGIAGCTALLVMGFGIRDSLSGLASRQFGDILHYDLIEVNKPNLSDDEAASLDKLLASGDIKTEAPVYFDQLTKVAGKDKNNQQINLIVPQDEANFSSFISLQERASGKKLTLSNKGVILSEKLAKLLHAKVGSTISLNSDEKDGIKMKVAGITEMYMGHYVFMNRSTYQREFTDKIAVNAHLITLKDGDDKNVQKMSVQLMKDDAVVAIVQNSELKGTIDSFLHGINSVMVILISCAIILAIVVIYNLTNINISERIRELSTIKVLGFYDREATFYIYRETIFLSFIGILCGYGLGAYLHHFIMTQLPPDYAMFNPSLLWSNYLLSAAITLATTFLLSILVHFQLKRVDMLGALKSVD